MAGRDVVCPDPGTNAPWIWSSFALEVAELRQWHGAQDNIHHCSQGDAASG